jgi:ribosomal protein S18 acetylase RimI-like enzyme
MAVSVSIRKASAADSGAIAALHLAQIPWGLLSGMGPGFVETFYRTLLDSPSGFAFIAERDGRPVGYCTAVVHWRRFYRTFVLRNWSLAARIVFKKIVGGGLRRLFETSRYAAAGALPEAELLSIALDPEARGAGAADGLVRAVLEEFSQRGVERVRVTTAVDNVAAAGVYERSGFTLLHRAEIHQGESASVYVITLGNRLPAESRVPS